MLFGPNGSYCREAMDSYDYESIKVTREHKVESLKNILKDAVDFKYRI